VDLSPEWRLLLACAKANLPAEEIHLIAKGLSHRDLDWNYIAAAACAHGIAPLIYHNLCQSRVTRVLPHGSMERLRNSYYGNAARNSFLYHELRNVLRAFREQQIEVVVLKGAALAEPVYPNRALRPMSDLDLLVKKEKLTEVETKLLDMGYILQDRGKGKEFYQERHYHWVFSKKPDLDIEIHWHVKRPTSAFEINIDELWKSTQAVKVASVGALILSPEVLLLYLCQHSWKHSLNGGMRPFIDIAQTTRFYASEINWQEVARLSAQWQMNPCAFLGFSLARDLLDARIPESCLKELRPENFSTAIMDWARERVLGYGESSPFSPDLLRLVWKGYGFNDRLHALQKVLSVSAVRRHCFYPSGSERIYLGYPRRIKYLLTRYGPVIWHLLAGDQKIRAVAEREENQLRLTNWLSEVSMSLNQK
jgi:Uncharacterised nucleotidyltransferase